jgi:HD-GYP domain-containing protein (c-di-GMP phosphodiesterase class II)
MVKILLIFKDDALRLVAETSLKAYYRDQVTVHSLFSVQDAVEYLETNASTFDLIVLEQRTPSLTMAKVLFPLGKGAKFILCDDAPIDIASLQQDYIIDQISIKSLDVDLEKMIKKFEVTGQIHSAGGVDDQYVSVRAEIVASYCPLNYDVYVKLGDGKFVKLFHKEDPIERADFDRYQKEKGVFLFYFKKQDYKEVLDHQTKRVDAIANTIPLPAEEVLIKEAVKSHAVVKDIISQLGFTPEAQALAKSCVAMTAKLISNKPQFSKILTDLRKKDGNYVGSHSISVGTVACAIAYKMEWHSAATYFKLSLAAFMHDITIDDKLARVHLVKEMTRDHFSADELNKIKLHPVHSADYVRKMSEIPSDVDQIVFQHHERPDGTGFPRNLSGKFISPLSGVFIVAHEIVEFMTKREGETIDVFLTENEELYKGGTFRKIWLALKS